MAEYRALAQNTYKFVHETTFHDVGNVSAPLAPILGKCKIIQGGSVFYNSFSTYGEMLDNEGVNLSIKKISATAQESNNYYPHWYLRSYNIPGHSVVDGKKYYGLKNARYFLFSNQKCSPSTGTAYKAICEKVTIPSGKIKIIKVLSNTFVTEELNIPKITLDEISSQGATSKYGIAIQGVYIIVPKSSGDIVVGIEIEYPKYNITINNAKQGLQYSLDDGITFQDVTEGLELSQIEHVVVKNTGETDINIGITEGGAEIATVPAGATRVIVPEADGVCYIS